ncbi:lipid A deacylase LpxR family protein [Marinospirillum perlucidum]|uniref:lipid A deacylase LpxR family protein n=1 Tax=Marinospirillum perlucidum TaxID=1982602 RepID=UPI000DF1A45D|nr:lipid A deacylase LpxR family protein [Marinospirillum perlucidum]
MRKLLLLVSLLLIVPMSNRVQAEVLALSWDNDIFFDSDGNYTNGLKFAWLSDEVSSSACQSCPYFQWLPGWKQPDSFYSVTWSLEQLMLTPSDISVAEPQYRDTPYAGLLRMQLGGYARTARSITGYTLSIGTTGEASQADASQRWVHQWTGSTTPQGWQHQLPTQPVVGMTALHARHFFHWQGDHFQVRGGWGLAGEADTWIVQSRTGAYLSWGQQLSGNLLPAYSVLGSTASLAGLGSLDSSGWSLYAGFTSQRILWSYLESEGQKAGYELEGRNWWLSGFLGATLHTPGMLVALSLERSSQVAQLSGQVVNYGSLALVWTY